MALKGTLKDFGLPDIFQLLSLQKKTGKLTVRSNQNEVIIIFRNGFIVSADSLQDPLEHRLGYLLVRHKVITKEQLKKALDMQKETLQHLGHILVSLRFLTAEKLQKYLQLVITQKIYRLFRWKEGEYNFEPREEKAFQDDYFIPLSTQAILMEAVRLLDEWPLIKKKIPSLELVFEKSRRIDPSSIVVSEAAEEVEEEKRKALAPSIGMPLVISPQAHLLYQAIDGSRTVKDLMDSCGFNDFETCRLLSQLMDKQLIRIKSHEVRPSEVKRVRFQIGALTGRFLYLLIIVLLVVGVLNILRNPLNTLTPFSPNTSYMVSTMKESISRGRMQQIAQSLTVYYLTYERYPTDLSSLVREGFLQSQNLTDPWGRDYHYQLLPDRYLLIGLDSQGRRSAQLTIEEPLLFILSSIK
ncbi:MAG: DUF4388 domain-containing protein [Acidobacteriota bacterium]